MKNNNRYKDIISETAVIVGYGLEVVYIIHYQGFEKRKKIGIATEQSLGARLLQIATTSAPGKIIVELIILTNDAKSIENILHTRLHKHRIRGEWFEIDELSSVIDPREFDTQSELATNWGQEVNNLKKQITQLTETNSLLQRIGNDISKEVIAFADQVGIGDGKMYNNQQFLEEIKTKIESIRAFQRQLNHATHEMELRESIVRHKEAQLKEKILELRDYENLVASEKAKIEKLKKSFLFRIFFKKI